MYKYIIQCSCTGMTIYPYIFVHEPLNNGHVGDKYFVHCSEVVPSSEVEMYGQLMAGNKQFVHCREVVLLLECPLSEFLLYTLVYTWLICFFLTYFSLPMYIQ